MVDYDALDKFHFPREAVNVPAPTNDNEEDMKQPLNWVLNCIDNLTKSIRSIINAHNCQNEIIEAMNKRIVVMEEYADDLEDRIANLEDILGE